MYLTPARFREMGFGIDTSELDNTELLSLVNQATTVVNAYCNVPRIPQMHDFRGGTITSEAHTWRYPVNSLDIGQRREYLFHWPILAIQNFRIYVTNTQYIEIAPTELMINNTERYFEIVSLAITSFGLFNALIVPNVYLASPLAKTSYTYGWDFTVTDEYLSCTDGQTWRAQNQFWFSDEARAPVIKKNGATVSNTPVQYTVDATEGTVVFTENLRDSDTVSASYHHKLPTDIQYGTGHIVAYLHGQAELQSRGMAHLTRLRVAEVDMEKDLRRAAPKGLVENLNMLVPEAALLLGAFAADNLTVR
jgi:hypothetical protein